MMIKDYRLLIKITSYPYGASVGIVCKQELLNTVFNVKWLILILLTNAKYIISKWLYIPDHP